MKKSDRPRFSARITALAAAHGVKTDEPMLEGYWLGLRDLDWTVFEACVVDAIRGSHYFPKPYDLRKLAGVSRSQHTAMAVWPQVVRAASGSGEVTDPLAKEVVKIMGGVRSLGRMREEDLHVWGRKDFEKIYADLAQRNEVLERVGSVTKPKELDGRVSEMVGELAEGTKV